MTKAKKKRNRKNEKPHKGRVVRISPEVESFLQARKAGTDFDGVIRRLAGLSPKHKDEQPYRNLNLYIVCEYEVSGPAYSAFRTKAEARGAQIRIQARAKVLGEPVRVELLHMREAA